MLNVVRADQRYASDAGWLKTYWLFSFSDYYDPQNVHFGALRVFNDDVVQAGHGFPPHPHREMEIITIPLSGELTHEDSAGHRGVIRAGDVQRMSAGSGVTHSEMNLGREPVHLYQIWLFPADQELPPSYEQRSFDPAAWLNTLLPVASGQGLPEAVAVHADATIYRARFDRPLRIDFGTAEERHLFIYLTAGTLDVNGTALARADQARITGERALALQADAGTEFVLIDVPPHEGA